MSDTHTDSTWTLVECSNEPDCQVLVLTLPDCVVGRARSADVRINDSSISKSHARIFFDSGEMYIEDLGSTNGTFLNGDPVKRNKLSIGDLVQFANLVFRFETEQTDDNGRTIEEIPFDLANKLLNFDRLMSERAVTPLFQPIVTMGDQSTCAYEMLACSHLKDLETAADVFGTAEILKQEAALSELLREEGTYVASQSDQADKRFFFNIDPVEFGTNRLNESLVRLREKMPDLKLTLEVHEKAVTKLNVLRAFRRTLKSLDIQLAYDDFGAGQGRLLELTEVPPDVVKFDMRLIRDIDKASDARLSLLRSLVKASTDCGSQVLAECVETKEEHEVCLELGFHLGQGFYYGRPTKFDTRD